MVIVPVFPKLKYGHYRSIWRRVDILIRYAPYADDFLVAIKSPHYFHGLPASIGNFDGGYDILALVGPPSKGIDSDPAWEK